MTAEGPGIIGDSFHVIKKGEKFNDISYDKLKVAMEKDGFIEFNPKGTD